MRFCERVFAIAISVAITVSAIVVFAVVLGILPFFPLCRHLDALFLHGQHRCPVFEGLYVPAGIPRDFQEFLPWLDAMDQQIIFDFVQFGNIAPLVGGVF